MGPRNTGLSFQPKQGQILICDFDTGFKAPEMIKTRPVVVVSPKRRFSSGLCTVVPLSTTAPNKVMPWHMQFPDNLYPKQKPGSTMWVKGDHVITVGLYRLDRIKVRFRHYVAPQVPDSVMKQIHACILHALGVGDLDKHL